MILLWRRFVIISIFYCNFLVIIILIVLFIIFVLFAQINFFLMIIILLSLILDFCSIIRLSRRICFSLIHLILITLVYLSFCLCKCSCLLSLSSLLSFMLLIFIFDEVVNQDNRNEKIIQNTIKLWNYNIINRNHYRNIPSKEVFFSNLHLSLDLLICLVFLGFIRFFIILYFKLIQYLLCLRMKNRESKAKNL